MRSNIPAAPANKVYIFQFIRYSRARGSYFGDTELLIRGKLLKIISIFPLCTFHLYVATLQQRLQIEHSKTCLNRTPLGLNNLLSLDRRLVYTGSNYIDL